MSASKKSLKQREYRWYGMKKVKVGSKVCWLAKQDKNGWSLGLALGKKTLWLRNLRLASEGEVKRVVKGSIVFIHVKGK